MQKGDPRGSRNVEKLAALSGEGVRTAKGRGHRMMFIRNITGERGGGFGRYYECRVCGAYFEARTHPMPNQIELGGDALALECPGGEVRNG